MSSEAKLSHPHDHSHFQLDRIGIGVSALCLAHCLALPLILTFAPLFELLTDWHQPFHIGVFVMAAPVAFVSLRQGFRHHKSPWILLLGGLGCGLIFYSILLDLAHHSAAHGFEMSSTLVLNGLGGLSLAMAHLLNIRACRSKQQLHAAHH